MRVWVSASIGLLALGLSGLRNAGYAAAETDTATAANGTVLMFRFIPDAGVPSVVNGITVHPEDWPALVRTTNCTAALVGPRVLLTAAHCVDGGAQNTVNAAKIIQRGGTTIDADCVMHPRYSAAPFQGPEVRNSADYALCILGTSLADIPRYRSLLYENVDLGALTKGSPVLITGFGCNIVEKGPGGGGPQYISTTADPVLRVGDAFIEADLSAESDNYRTHSTNPRTASICPGDSGGPLIIGASTANQAGRRSISGVNSTVEVKPRDVSDLTSRFAALATADFRAFLSAFLRDHGNPVVCNVNHARNSYPCRS